MNQDTQSTEREKLLKQIWESENETYTLTATYDSLPHQYGNNVLYQAEAITISLIATQPGITATELAALLNKTPSACSQMVHKLREKGWIEQSRNEQNNRLYNLQLTDSGWDIYQCHDAFTRECQAFTYKMLEEYTLEELACFLRIRNSINTAYANDVSESRKLLENRS